MNAGKWIAALAVGVALCASARPAHARSWRYFEGTVGVSQPLGLSDYTGFAGPGVKAGRRTGLFLCPPEQRRIGYELDVDFTRIQNELAIDANFYRLRLMFGGRLEQPAGGVVWVARLVGGVDYLIGSVDDFVVGEMIREETQGLGPVVEPGAAVMWRFPTWYTALNVAVPIGFHYDGDPGDRTF